MSAAEAEPCSFLCKQAGQFVRTCSVRSFVRTEALRAQRWKQTPAKIGREAQAHSEEEGADLLWTISYQMSHH